MTLMPLYDARERSLTSTHPQLATGHGSLRVRPLCCIVIPLNDVYDCLAPQKSLLRPPKLAPSAWQLYFTDWIQRHQASSTRKLNVAQAAKEAGVEYAKLSPQEKEV